MELIFKAIILTACIFSLLTVCFFPLSAQTPTSPPSPSPSPRTQSIVYVSGTTGSDESGDGSQGNPWATIQHAIDSTMGSQTEPVEVHVAWGTYTENIVMKEYSGIYGGYNPFDWSRDIEENQTTIDGSSGGAYPRTVTAVSNTNIDGFTITCGGFYVGGGIICQGRNTEISHCTFEYNGVGVNYYYTESSSVFVVRSCIFRNNDVGIIGYESFEEFLVSDCLFENNGEGVDVSLVDISDSLFLENTGDAVRAFFVRAADSEFINNEGYAVSSLGGDLTRCTVRNNGRGIAFLGNDGAGGSINQCLIIGNGSSVSGPDLDGTLYVGNSVIADNGYIGIGLGVPGGNVTVWNSTITGHSNYGICNRLDSTSIEVTNCIVWDNGDDLYNVSSTYSDIQDGDPGEGNISVDPRFIDPANDNYRLSFGSPCIDAGTFASLTEDCAGNPRPVDGDFSGVAEYDMGAYEYMPRSIVQGGDYNGDGAADIAVFRPSTGLWAVRGLERVYFGSQGDLPVSGDYDGDGTTDIGIFRPGLGLWGVRGVTRVYYGSASDVPVPADYNGDGNTDITIFRPSTGLWGVAGVTRAYFGGSGDVPAPGDYDGDGTEDIAIFRPSSGLWSVRGWARFYFGVGGDIPVPADYYGSGLTTAAIHRPSQGLWASAEGHRIYFGGTNDQPVPADYDGDLRDDIGIFRPSSGLWEIREISRAYFGTSGDIPVTR